MSLIGDIIGGGLQLYGSKLAADAAQDAARAQVAAVGQNAQAALEAATPYTVGGLGGIAEFDPATQTGLLALSPELANIFQGAIGRSGLFGGQAMKYAEMDPFAAGDLFYQQQQPYFQEEEDRLRTDLETRLLSQGRLGSTGGQRDQRALEEAIGASQAKRRDAGFSKAQALISTLLGREKGDLGLATSLLDVPLQYAKLGRGIGGDLGATARAGLASQAEAEKSLATTAAAYPGLFSQGLSALGKDIRGSVV